MHQEASLKSKTIRFEDLQKWRQDNPYIRTGYRPNLPDMLDCLGSVFGYFHNETVNIHTHLWAAVTFLSFILSLNTTSSFIPWAERAELSTLPKSVNWRDTLVFGSYFLSATICLSFSALYHTVTCHSERVCSTFGRLDYIGIAWLIVGSFYPSIYYGFYCHPHLTLGYIALITTLGSLATYTVITPRYRSAEGRKQRTVIFVALGLSALLPIGHGVTKFGMIHSAERSGLGWIVLSGALYILGAVFYAERFPERFNPGKFDLVGASHQIFHVLVVVAALCHYVAISKAFTFTHQSQYSYCTPGTF